MMRMCVEPAEADIMSSRSDELVTGKTNKKEKEVAAAPKKGILLLGITRHRR